MRIHWNQRIIYLICFITCLFILLLKLISFNQKSLPFDLREIDTTILEKLGINREVYGIRIRRYEHYKSNQYYQKGPGENGASVSLTNEESKQLDSVMKEEAFNRPTSDRISLQRSLPDFRSKECKQVTYPKNLPSLSVVIIFHNEAWSALLRTAHSVVNRTPPQFLKEVILLDDASYKARLGTELDEYVQKTWPDGIVKIVRRLTRLGLIKARLEGAKAATGDVLMFLDSHCEVTEGWAEPLLYRISEKRETMMIPVIEGIDSKIFSYYGSSELGSTGTFWWSMHFTWEGVPEHFKKEIKSPADPVKSATMAGGLFAAERKYFFEIGSYDEGMDIWGGENLEISFRVWTCGGTLESSPCSHVGHIFRASHPYTFPGNKDYHGLNSKRMVDVWLDEYKRLFYMHRRDLINADSGNISSRIELRKRLNCKPFKWYVQNVVPNKFIPDENVLAYGYLENSISGLCLDLLGQNEFDRGNLVTGLYACQNGASSQQIFSFYPKQYSHLTNKDDRKFAVGQIRREWGCLTATKHFGVVQFLTCESNIDSQLWNHDFVTGSTVSVKFRQCLDSTGLKNSDSLVIKPCTSSNKYQRWTFQYYL